MNKQQIAYEKCKRVAQSNTKCMSILLKLLGTKHEVLIDQIAEINRMQYDAITPEGIVAAYNRVGEDIDKFILMYEKAMESANWIRKNYGG